MTVTYPITFTSGPDTVHARRDEYGLTFRVVGPRGGMYFFSVPSRVIPELLALIGPIPGEEDEEEAGDGGPLYQWSVILEAPGLGQTVTVPAETEGGARRLAEAQHSGWKARSATRGELICAGERARLCPSNHWNDGNDVCADCGADLQA